jgi:hypothetical protein
MQFLAQRLGNRPHFNYPSLVQNRVGEGWATTRDIANSPDHACPRACRVRAAEDLSFETRYA